MTTSIAIDNICNIDDSLAHLNEFAFSLKLQLDCRQRCFVKLPHLVEDEYLIFFYSCLNIDSVVFYLFILSHYLFWFIRNEVDFDVSEQWVVFNL